MAQLMAQEWMYIASRGEEKIFRCLLNPKTGEMTDMQVAVDAVRPEYFASHPELPVIYVGITDNSWKEQGKLPAGVHAFQLNTKSGELESLGAVGTDDHGNTHIAISPEGKTILSVAYGGEGTRSLRTDDKGKLIADSGNNIAHEGSSVHKRQATPHPHGSAIHPDGRFCCVADLGNEHIEIYSLDSESNIAKHSRWKATDGAGPRHVAFHPNGRWLYCINELDGTINVLAFDSTGGELTLIQTVPTLPDEFTGENTTAGIVVHPNGKFAYGSNRGHDSTAVYTIDQTDGRLTRIQLEPTGGEHPRFVGLNTNGTVYVAANMDSDNMVTFFVDQNTGKLQATGHSIAVKEPRGIGFVPKTD